MTTGDPIAGIEKLANRIAMAIDLANSVIVTYLIRQKRTADRGGYELQSRPIACGPADTKSAPATTRGKGVVARTGFVPDSQ